MHIFTLNDLPVELIVYILSLVDVSDAPQIFSTCRRWLACRADVLPRLLYASCRGQFYKHGIAWDVGDCHSLQRAVERAPNVDELAARIFSLHANTARAQAREYVLWACERDRPLLGCVALAAWKRSFRDSQRNPASAEAHHELALFVRRAALSGANDTLAHLLVMNDAASLQAMNGSRLKALLTQCARLRHGDVISTLLAHLKTPCTWHEIDDALAAALFAGDLQLTRCLLQGLHERALDSVSGLEITHTLCVAVRSDEASIECLKELLSFRGGVHRVSALRDSVMVQRAVWTEVVLAAVTSSQFKGAGESKLDLIKHCINTLPPHCLTGEMTQRWLIAALPTPTLFAFFLAYVPHRPALPFSLYLSACRAGLAPQLRMMLEHDHSRATRLHELHSYGVRERFSDAIRECLVRDRTKGSWRGRRR